MTTFHTYLQVTRTWPTSPSTRCGCRSGWRNWLEKEEQARLEATIKDRLNIPINIFGDNRPRMTETRRRYELLFGLLL
jgi:hypothetical protein